MIPRRLSALLLLVAVTVAAQSTSTIHAVVTDGKGHPVPNLPSL